MKKNIEISVIIPIFNRHQLLNQTIESVVQQNSSLEIIIVDDGSNQPFVPKLVLPNIELKIIRSKENKGPAWARNIGLKMARGKYIAFLDSDDRWKKNFLKNSISVLKNHEEIVASLSLSSIKFNNNMFSNSIKNLMKLICYFKNGKRLPIQAFFLIQLSHMIFLRSKINFLRFNTGLKLGEDWHFVMQSAELGTIAIIPKSLVDHLKNKVGYSHMIKTHFPYRELRDYSQIIKRLEKSYNEGFFYYLFKLRLKMIYIKTKIKKLLSKT